MKDDKKLKISKHISAVSRFIQEDVIWQKRDYYGERLGDGEFTYRVSILNKAINAVERIRQLLVDELERIIHERNQDEN